MQCGLIYVVCQKPSEQFEMDNVIRLEQVRMLLKISRAFLFIPHQNSLPVSSHIQMEVSSNLFLVRKIYYPPRKPDNFSFPQQRK